MKSSAILCVSLALLAILNGCTNLSAAQTQPLALRTRVYLCSRTGRYRIPNAWHYPNFGHHSPRIARKGVPVYRRVRETWLEIFLPDQKLAVRYGSDTFFDATIARYEARTESVEVAYNSPRRGPKVRTEVRIDATELNALMLTDEARAKLNDALKKHLKSKQTEQ